MALGFDKFCYRDVGSGTDRAEKNCNERFLIMGLCGFYDSLFLSTAVAIARNARVKTDNAAISIM